MRRLAALALAVAAVLPAAAQSPPSPQDSGRQFEAGRGAELQQWQWRAQRGAELTPAQKAVEAVQQALGKRDCAGVVAALNAGLAKAHPEIYTLAGALYEEGVCVRPNWERAVGLYERAIAQQHPGVMARLAAGYASTAGGKDLAAALWWATRARTALPAPCAEVAPLAADADKFIAALQAWPAGRFEACAYAAAVMASVQSELEQPDLASSFGMAGTAVLRFTPAEGRIDIDDSAIAAPPAAGLVVPGSASDSERRAARQAFVAQIRAAADRALKRYDKPAGVPAEWRVEARPVFAAAR